MSYVAIRGSTIYIMMHRRDLEKLLQQLKEYGIELDNVGEAPCG